MMQKLRESFKKPIQTFSDHVIDKSLDNFKKASEDQRNSASQRILFQEKAKALSEHRGSVRVKMSFKITNIEVTTLSSSMNQVTMLIKQLDKVWQSKEDTILKYPMVNWPGIIEISRARVDENVSVYYEMPHLIFLVMIVIRLTIIP